MLLLAELGYYSLTALGLLIFNIHLSAATSCVIGIGHASFNLLAFCELKNASGFDALQICFHFANREKFQNRVSHVFVVSVPDGKMSRVSQACTGFVCAFPHLYV